MDNVFKFPVAFSQASPTLDRFHALAVVTEVVFGAEMFQA